MKRTLIALVALVGLTASANAATLTIGGGGSYNVGDLITLTVSGNAQGGTSDAVFGRLNFSNPTVAAISTGVPVQNTLTSLGGAIPWLGPAALACNANSCTMMDQVQGLTSFTPDNALVSSVSFLATTPGTTNVAWELAAVGFELNFFGLSNAPGTTITVNVVPEPTTAALLGLGLFGLAVAGRRR